MLRVWHASTFKIYHTEKGRGNESADGGAREAKPPASGSNDTLEPKVFVLSLVLGNFFLYREEA